MPSLPQPLPLQPTIELEISIKGFLPYYLTVDSIIVSELMVKFRLGTTMLLTVPCDNLNYFRNVERIAEQTGHDKMPAPTHLPFNAR